MTHDKIDLQIEGIISNIKQMEKMIQEKRHRRDVALDIIATKKEEVKAWDNEIKILLDYMHESEDLVITLKVWWNNVI